MWYPFGESGGLDGLLRHGGGASVDGAGWTKEGRIETSEPTSASVFLTGVPRRGSQ